MFDDLDLCGSEPGLRFVGFGDRCFAVSENLRFGGRVVVPSAVRLAALPVGVWWTLRPTG